MILLTLSSLAFVFSLCVWGALSKVYHESTLQNLGLGTTALGCVAAMAQLWAIGCMTAQGVALLAAGLAVFAGGTAAKVWKFRHATPLGQTKELK